METTQTTLQDLSQKFVDIWTKDKKEYIGQIFSTNVHYILNGESIKGENPLATHFVMVETAFTDLQCTVEDTFFAADHIIHRWTSKGVFTGPYKGITPTHKPVEYSGITILRVQDNKIKDVWIYNNLTEALEETSTQSTSNFYQVNQ